MATIFMDESGYNGEDLMNKDQPYFSLATLCCPEEKCAEYKAKYFKKVQAPELKHKILIRNERQPLILDFLEEITQTPELIKVCITHKRYALVEKMITYVVEPVAKKAGNDLRIKGKGSSLAYYIYSALPQIAGQSFFEDLLRRFQKMMIRLDHEAYLDFFNPLFDERYPKVGNQELQEVLDFFLERIKEGHVTIGYDLVDQIQKTPHGIGISRNRPLDIAFPSANILMSLWRKDINDSITLIHDKSSRMAEMIELWKTFYHPYPPPAILQFSTTPTSYSVGLEGTYLSDSKEWVGLQLADILAGASCWWAKWLLGGKSPSDKYGNALDTLIPRFHPFTNLPPPDTTHEYFEENGPTEEEVREMDNFYETLAAFHMIRGYGYSYQIPSNN